MINRDPLSDALGNQIFIGAAVATSVGAGRSSSAIRWGTVVSYDEGSKELKIKGGNCPKVLSKRTNQVIVLFLPGEIPNDA